MKQVMEKKSDLLRLCVNTAAKPLISMVKYWFCYNMHNGSL